MGEAIWMIQTAFPPEEAAEIIAHILCGMSVDAAIQTTLNHFE